MKYRHLLILPVLFLISLLAASSLHAQEPPVGKVEESKFPTRGVRFVICSATGETLPTPLYAKVDKEYLPIHISSRMPSPRLQPEKDVINLYETAPSTDPKKAKETKPYLSIPIPKNHRNKSICVVQPVKDAPTKPKTFFLKESEFSLGGVYVVNLSASTLEMITYPSGSTSGEEVVTKIAPYDNAKDISRDAPYVWSYKGKKARVPFVLKALLPGGKNETRRIKASAFHAVAPSAQVSFVMDHPTLKSAYRLISLQYGNEELPVESRIMPPPPPAGAE